MRRHLASLTITCIWGICIRIHARVRRERVSKVHPHVRVPREQSHLLGVLGHHGITIPGVVTSGSISSTGAGMVDKGAAALHVHPGQHVADE